MTERHLSNLHSLKYKFSKREIDIAKVEAKVYADLLANNPPGFYQAVLE